MKYAFFGSPEFAALILEKLITTGLPPALVVCNPDRPAGRKKIITPPPTKTLAEKYKIMVAQPELLAASEFKGLEFGVVAAYAKILPKEVIDAFPKGIIGVHPSLLPKYRGATPIQSVILAGEKETGTTLYMLDEKVDHGKIVASSKQEVARGETYETLLKKLAELSGDLLVETLPKFASGAIKPVPQNESEATYTKKFKTEDARVSLESDDPSLIERKIRALNPEPGVWTMLNGKRTKILEASVRDGKISFKKIQVEGGKPETIKD